jgi:hypothetical protein
VLGWIALGFDSFLGGGPPSLARSGGAMSSMG